ncbi:MAG TPA: GNAT family N-acetyltransferase, partial [Tepidisphaeraceae bacterium]
MNTAPDILIRLARTPEILDLRWRMLRAGLPPDSANFDGDAEPTTHHFVAEQDGKVIGCVTILRRPWEGRPAWQLRGMAVEPFVQSRG